MEERYSLTSLKLPDSGSACRQCFSLDCLDEINVDSVALLRENGAVLC